MPIRIQRKRTAGWKMPEGAVYVGRPTIYGNPFKEDGEHWEGWAKDMFHRWMLGEKATGGGGLRRIALLAALDEIRGKDLACWCALDQPCHADVLLEIANQDASLEASQ